MWSFGCRIHKTALQRILGIACSYELQDCEPPASLRMYRVWMLLQWDKEEAGKSHFLSHLKKPQPEIAGFRGRWQVSPWPQPGGEVMVSSRRSPCSFVGTAPGLVGSGPGFHFKHIASPLCCWEPSWAPEFSEAAGDGYTHKEHLKMDGAKIVGLDRMHRNIHETLH